MKKKGVIGASILALGAAAFTVVVGPTSTPPPTSVEPASVAPPPTPKRPTKDSAPPRDVPADSLFGLDDQTEGDSVVGLGDQTEDDSVFGVGDQTEVASNVEEARRQVRSTGILAALDLDSEPTTTVERYPNIESSRCAALNAPFDLSVWLTEKNTVHVAKIQAGPKNGGAKLRMTFIGAAPWSVDVTLLAAGFAVEGPPQGRLTLPAHGASTKARFRLTPRSPGDKIIYAILNDDRGQQMGIISHEVKVGDGARACGTATSSAGVVALTGAQPPDLTIMLQEDPHTGRAELYARSPHFVERRSQQPDIDLRALRAHVNKKLRSIIGERGARARSGDATVAPDVKLKSLGKRLYQQLSTPQLREMLRAVSSKPAHPTILVISNTPDIPFELMLPSPLQIKGRPARFLGTDFVISRANLGKRSSALAQAPPQVVTLRSREPALGLIVPRYQGVKALPSQVQEIETIRRFSKHPPAELPATRALTAKMNQVRPPIIHFAGHGEVHDPESPAPDFRLMLEDGHLTLDEWREASDWETYRPLLFLNACSLGQSASTGGFADGWGPAMLDAGVGGVIGGLWPLGDNGAADFAARFYTALEKYPGVGHALRKAREGYYETGDPTYLAYVLYGDPNLRLETEPYTLASALDRGMTSADLRDALSRPRIAGQPALLHTRLGDLTVETASGTPPPKPLERAVRRLRGRLTRCFRNSTAAQAGDQGAVNIELIVDRMGEARGRVIASSWLEEAPVRTCIEAAFGQLRVTKDTVPAKTTFRARFRLAPRLP